MIDPLLLGYALLTLGSTTVVAALVCVTLIILLRPWLEAYALAHPNARSSHRKPTAQGGGIAVIVATLAAAWLGMSVFWHLMAPGLFQFLVLTLAVLLLALVGAVDDLRGLPVLPRLIVQALAVGGVVATLPADLHVVSWLPLWVERIGLLVAGLWFVNLVNFMDGIDWMTVAEVVPITAAIALAGVFDAISPLALIVALALLGGIIGFAPFNRPVARLFLGDVGSLPIGLILCWLLLHLAARGHVAAALLLPLYYLADATLTLGRRLAAGERIWEAHRSHFYQRATDRGLTVGGIVGHVFLANVVLAALAVVTIIDGRAAVAVVALAIGSALVGWLLWRLAQGKP